MYTRDLIHDLEATLGPPRLAKAIAPFGDREYELVAACGRRGRAHDVTLLVLSGQAANTTVAVIRKPSYPAGVFRPPSGGVDPGEPFLAGAVREAWEETGLLIRPERYLLRVDAVFTRAQHVAPWTTHVLLASAVGGELAPVDRKEIEEARWASLAELAEVYRPRMLAMGSAGMRYRVDLQDAALAAMNSTLSVPVPAPPLPGYAFSLLACDPANEGQ